MTRAVEQRGAAGGRAGAEAGGMGGSRGRSYLADPSPNLPGVSAEKFSGCPGSNPGRAGAHGMPVAAGAAVRESASPNHPHHEAGPRAGAAGGASPSGVARWAAGVLVDAACAITAAGVIAGLVVWGWVLERWGKR
jgi:hypothetical protein